MQKDFKRIAKRKKTEDGKIIEVINRVAVRPDSVELGPTRRLGLDACGCTGNSFCLSLENVE